ncbi:MAG: hypothetical protein JXR37_24985 [Kiritimatiellae bacterium]|nr:hypothetical protein [Kiritimatiellia bacterium]
MTEDVAAEIDLERKSSAVTLSDMEVFVFPELIYSLVLANIMSPRIWQWREDPFFAKLAKMSPYRRAQRVKQYVMDNYAFNLDLETWGLTTKKKELRRFKNVIDEYALKRSNALFGYEGDKYYFDIDIRAHFGLDKFTSDVIPYWKTETIEAMDAFRHRPNYGTGAGECVSLATLYAAAMFIVAELPLSDIFLMATPLHSQTFFDVGDGLLSNNRRLVTKNMWFNGTALSAKARRALENEQVTIVAHETGYVHTLFREATIDKRAFSHFAGRLRSFLRTDITDSVLGNFLRHQREFQRCFQIRWPVRGVDHYIGAECVFSYEHNSKNIFTDNTRPKLMDEIDLEEFHCCPMEKRVIVNDLEDYIRTNSISLCNPTHIGRLKRQFASDCLDAEIAIESLLHFCRTDPKLPAPEQKVFAGSGSGLGITPEMSREEIIAQLESLRGQNRTADLAFYAYRDLTRSEPDPFICAAIDRNPVSIEAVRDVGTWDVFARMENLENESIYDERGRLAQPDEVWNFGRGDGVEKALLLANIVHDRMPEEEIVIDVYPDQAVFKAGSEEFTFASSKGLDKQVWDITG